MSGWTTTAAEPARAVLVVLGAVAALLLATVLPSALVVASDSGSVAVAVVALAVAALLRSGHAHHAGLHLLPALATPPSGAAPPLLTGRATDPVHHPLRPRAPGPL